MFKLNFYIFYAFLSYTILSTGLILMKKGISFIGYKGKKDKIFYLNMILWITGFILTNISVIPNAIALKNLNSYLVSSVAGWGIIILIAFSSIILKEKVYGSDYLFGILIISGIFLINFFDKNNGNKMKNLKEIGLLMVSLIPIVLFISGLIVKKKFIKTLLFSLASGMSAGLIVLFIGVFMNKCGYSFKCYLSDYSFYLYAFFSILAFVSLQFAYKNGEMILIGPVQYSLNIIYPALGEFLIYHTFINFFQIVSIILIVVGVVMILIKHS